MTLCRRVTGYRSRVHWNRTTKTTKGYSFAGGVKVDDMLIAAFAWKTRAEQFAVHGWRDTYPPHRIEVVFLGEDPAGEVGGVGGVGGAGEP